MVILTEDAYISVKDGILHFPDPEVFENFLLGLEEYPIVDKHFFVSLSAFIEGNTDKNFRLSENEFSRISEFQDTPLLGVLDKYGVVVIGDYIISLDFGNEVAGITKDESLIPLLKNKDFTDEKIQVYSFEEELLSILFENEDKSGFLSDGKENNIGINLRIMECNTGTPKPGLNLPYRPTPPSGVTNPTVDRVATYSESKIIGLYEYKIQAKHAYQAAALYFRLKSELEHYRRLNDGHSFYSPDQDPFMSITYWGDFTPKNWSKRFLDNCWDSCQGCSPQPAKKEKVQKIHWESGRRLTQVNLHGIYRGKFGGSFAGINAIPYEFRLVPINRN